MTGIDVFVVGVEASAETDLFSIADYLAEHSSRVTAAEFVAAVTARIDTLATFPLRGSMPSELSGTGQDQYRQVLHGRYRIIYRVQDNTVAVVLVADGRRDMQALLRNRLLERDTSA